MAEKIISSAVCFWPQNEFLHQPSNIKQKLRGEGALV